MKEKISITKKPLLLGINLTRNIQDHVKKSLNFTKDIKGYFE